MLHPIPVVYTPSLTPYISDFSPITSGAPLTSRTTNSYVNRVGCATFSACGMVLTCLDTRRQNVSVTRNDDENMHRVTVCPCRHGRLSVDDLHQGSVSWLVHTSLTTCFMSAYQKSRHDCLHLFLDFVDRH